MQTIARNGYTADEIKAALHNGERRLSFYYNLLDTTNALKGMLDNVLSASVEYNSLAEIKRTARFAVKDDGTINFLSDRIQPVCRIGMPTLIEKTEDTQADLGTGTLKNLTATAEGDLTIVPKAVPIFTRATVANKSDGSQVASGVQRYETMSGKTGIMIEEGTTNLLSANQSNVETDLTGLVGWQATLARITTDKYHGTACAEATLTAGSGAVYTANTNASALPVTTVGTKYTGSVWIKAPVGKQVYPVLKFTGGAQATVSISGSTVVATGNWQQLTVTGAIDYTDRTKPELHVILTGVIGDKLLFDEAQIEQKDHVTSWILGGTTRNDESLYLGDAALFVDPPLTIETEVYVPSDYLTNRKRRVIFSCTEAGGYNVILDNYSTSEILGDAYFGGSYKIPKLPLSYLKGGAWNKIALVITPSDVSLYVVNANGTFKNTVAASGAFAYPSNSAHKKIFLGTENNAGSAYSPEFTNYLLDNFRLSNKARTQQEIEDSFLYGYTVDENTLYYLPFSNSLTHGEGGSRELPAIPVSSLGSAASTSIDWSATIPTGTSLKVQKKEAGSWRDLQKGGSIYNPRESLKGKNLELRIVQLTDDTASVPSLGSLTYRMIGGKMGGFADFPLGVFILTTPPRRIDAAGIITRDVEAYDQLWILQNNQIDQRYTSAAGANPITEIAALLTGAGITLQNLTATTLTLPTAKDWEIGTTKLQIINDLLSAINYTSLWFDENGVAIAQPYTAPTNRAAEYDYITDSKSVVKPEAEDELDLFKIPNKWILVVSESDRTPIVSTVINSDPADPLSTVSRGITITRFETVDAVDQTTLDAKAAKMAQEDKSIYNSIEFKTAIMPIHSNLDTYNLNYSDFGTSDKFAETSWGFSLQAGAEMTHKARKVVIA